MGWELITEECGCWKRVDASNPTKVDSYELCDEHWIDAGEEDDPDFFEALESLDAS